MKNLKLLSIVFIYFLITLTACNQDSSELISSEDIIQTITIIEHHQSNITDRSEYLSLEQAAIVGVEYILEFYEFDFEGTYMELRLIKNTENTFFDYNNQPIWYGRVKQSEQWSPDNLIFVFSFNAQNGDWFHLGALNHESLRIEGYSLNELLDKSMHQFEPILPPIEVDEINEMLIVATDYAQRYFRNSNLSMLEFDFELTSGIRFKAEDELGQIIYVLILRDNHVLIGFDLPMQ